ncbi:MAG: hypothetical protein NTW28_22940, partial [Candidatus Solibacter sp.]|nr:hypothetical protein [Candidatus Solibacter sp.]
MARHLVVVGRRGGEAVVNWPGVLLVFAISLVVAESVTALGSLAIINRIAPLPLFTVFVSVLAGIAASVIRKKLATPLDKLVPLDEPHDAAGVPPRSLPLFVERDGRWRLYWPGVLLFCGTLGLVVLGVNLAIALVLWLLNAPVRLTFRPGELMLVLMLMAACVIMRLAALKLGSSETARAGSAPKAKVSTARKVIIAFLAIAVAVGSGLVIMLLAYMMSAKTSPPAPTMTSVASPLSSGPAITRVAVGANKAVIEGRGVPDAKFVFQVGKASLKCFFHNDSPFAATIERAWWGRGLNFF